MADNGSSPAAGVIEHKAYVRIGLLGHPTDVYYGRTISLSLSNFWASVRLEPSRDLVIVPHPTHDLVQFNSLPHLVSRLENEGYCGGVRLLMATCKVFTKYCKQVGIDLHNNNFTLSYENNIPRQTGLSACSVIVCAAFSCLLDFYGVRESIGVEIRPQLILNAEKELGGGAGLQDRVAQVYGGLGYMDFNKESMDKCGHFKYSQLDISLLPDLHLIYPQNPSDVGKVQVVHSTVLQRWVDGDKFIISTMEEIANLALEGKKALLEKDYAKLATLMNRNFDLLRQMFGDEALGALNIEMVEVARRVGAASKFTGNGGAVVAFCPEGPSQIKLLQDACKKAGFIMEPVNIVPSLFNQIEKWWNVVRKEEKWAENKDLEAAATKKSRINDQGSHQITSTEERTTVEGSHTSRLTGREAAKKAQKRKGKAGYSNSGTTVNDIYELQKTRNEILDKLAASINEYARLKKDHKLIKQKLKKDHKLIKLRSKKDDKLIKLLAIDKTNFTPIQKKAYDKVFDTLIHE